jgi:dienelactone hydrolase
MRFKFYFLCLSTAVVLLNFPTILKAQPTERLVSNANINSDCNGYWEYLPDAYDPNGSTLYPLFFYFHGLGEVGNGNTELTKLYQAGDGPPYFVHVENTNLSSFVTPTGTQKAIILAPQWIRSIHSWDDYPTIEEINNVLNYFLERYKIDRTRIYFMGISSGGGSVMHYAREGSFYANRLAAIIPFSGTDTPTVARAAVLVDRKIPIWGFHNSADAEVPPFYTAGWEDAIKAANGGNLYSPTPKFTIFQTTDPGNHVSWWDATKGIYKEGGLNVYEWALQFSAPSVAPNQAPIANAGPDQSMVFPANSIQLQSNSTDLDNYTLFYSWVQLSGPNTATITNGTTANPTVSNLGVGTYSFQLTVSDGSLQGSSIVNVTVQPAGSPVKIEAENYSLKSGSVQSFSNPSTSNGAYMGNVNPGDWLEYQINTLGGEFNFVFHVTAAFSGNFTVSIGNSSPVTVFVPATGDFQTFINVSLSNVSVPAGQQTVRIGSGGGGWGMDYFTFTGSSFVLPLKFVYFNSQCSNGITALQWKTAQEQNTKSFSIQRSTDGTSWSEIVTIAAAGQSTQEKSYAYQDKNPGSNSMYRIVQYDLNGQYTVSSIVKNSCSAKYGVSLYPNPTIDFTSLNLNLERSTKITLQLVDSKGAVLQRRQIQLPAGNTTILLNLSTYPKGVYGVNVQYNNEMKTIKLIKK